MKLRIPLKFAATFALMLVLTLSGQVLAQSGCARCASPTAQDQRDRWNGNSPGTVTRYRIQRGPVEDTPPVPSPYYSLEPANSDVGFRQGSDDGDDTGTMLVPTNSRKLTPFEKRKAPQKPVGAGPSIADKIGQRYADPRVVRMLQQLTPSSVESLYVEASELIDGRHISPATYKRRVDSAVSHLIQALDVPSFINAAQVQGSPDEIAGFQKELEDYRAALVVQNLNDARTAMKKVQLMAAQTIDINPSAIGLEFVYGATDSLDQFSMLLPPEKSGGPSVGLRDNVVGIGVEVESHPAGLKILKLLSGGPAAQADLRPGDVITHVDGNDLKQLELNRAVDFMVGPVGSPIQIQASRAGKSGKVTLVRQKITVHSVTNVHIEDSTRGIGYLKLEQFAESTSQELDAALLKLHQQGMQSLIMDLRGNPGGLLTTAIEVSDKFLPSGTIVSTRGRTQDDNSKEVAQLAKTWKVPLVVLIDHNSASASEIFAAAIQENGRGLIVGEKSYGKGTVQTLFPLQSFPVALRLTTAKFYSPQGHEMAGVGVSPDVKVASDPDANLVDDSVLMEAVRRINDPRIKEMAERYRRTGETTNDNHVAA